MAWVFSLVTTPKSCNSLVSTRKRCWQIFTLILLGTLTGVCASSLFLSNSCANPCSSLFMTTMWARISLWFWRISLSCPCTPLQWKHEIYFNARVCLHNFYWCLSGNLIHVYFYISSLSGITYIICIHLLKSIMIQLTF